MLPTRDRGAVGFVFMLRHGMGLWLNLSMPLHSQRRNMASKLPRGLSQVISPLSSSRCGNIQWSQSCENGLKCVWMGNVVVQD